MCPVSLQRRLGTTMFLSSSFERFYTFVEEYKLFFITTRQKCESFYLHIFHFFSASSSMAITSSAHIFIIHINRFRYSWEICNPRYTLVFQVVTRVLFPADYYINLISFLTFLLWSVLATRLNDEHWLL